MANATDSSITLFQAPTGTKVVIRGLQTLEGTNVFKLTYGRRSGYGFQIKFVSQKGDARDDYARQGVCITSNKDWTAIVDGIEAVRTFAPAPLLEKPGWTAGYFAQSNGRVISPKGSRKGKAIFRRTASEAAKTKGKHSDWLLQIAEPLAGQHLPMVAVLAALAAPMLRFSGETQNFGFEFCGPPQTGKTTCLQLMASVAGNPAHIPTFNATKAGMEAMFPEHHDLPFPVDEANLVDERDRNALKEFAFRMANGTVKVTAFQPDRAQYRFIFTTSANRPFYEGLRDFNADTAGAALQRLLPLKIPADNVLGVFDFIPTGFPSSGAFAGHLREAMARLYGRPMQMLLRHLVNTRAKDAAGFSAKLQGRIRDFEAQVGITETQAGRSRASSAFGLLYAAGLFARAKGVLPQSWDCLAACLAGYRNYQAQLPDQTPLIARLITIATHPSTLDLRGRAVPALTDEELEQYGAFLVQGIRKRVELLLTEATRHRIFPDWASMSVSADFLACNRRDRDHITKQRQVREGLRKERFVLFILPEAVTAKLNPAKAVHA